MILVADHDCDYCTHHGYIISVPEDGRRLCRDCYSLWYPPRMTLLKFAQGNFDKLWNLEIGEYEDFSRIDDLSLCDWTVKCRQDTLYKVQPKVRAIVYHMEYHGDVACGRCVGYPFPSNMDECLSQACQKMAKRPRPEAEIQWPPQRSRYITWLKNQ